MTKVDNSWTLFLDRDGVINKRIFGGYILDLSEFEFADGVLSTFGALSSKFGRVVVVTNQQCVALEQLSEEKLDEIHTWMIAELNKVGGKIDVVFAAKEFKNQAPFRRKPSPKMAHEARELFPEIDFQKSIMVGDTDTDIQFGQDLGMKTVLIVSKEKTSVVADYTISNFSELLTCIE